MDKETVSFVMNPTICNHFIFLLHYHNRASCMCVCVRECLDRL